MTHPYVLAVVLLFLVALVAGCAPGDLALQVGPKCEKEVSGECRA